MKKIELMLKNILLRILLFFSRKQAQESNTEFGAGSRILFIRLNRIGDALVVTPLLDHIKKSFGCSITVLADTHNHFVFSHIPAVDKVEIFNKGLKGFFEALQLIKDGKFDTVVDLHDDVSTTVTYLIALCNAKNKFGLKKSNEIVYTKTAGKLNASEFHVVERIMEITKLFNLSYCKEEINIIYCPEEKSKATVMKNLARKFPGKKFLAGVNISAGSEARFWGIENFQKLIAFLSKYDIDILVITSTKDVNSALKITRNDSSNIFYSPSFDEFAVSTSQLDLLFTPDTSIIHLASAFRIPVFGLYVKYNTTDMIWTPYRSDYDCMVTTNYNLRDIQFEETITKFQPFLEKHIYESRTTKL